MVGRFGQPIEDPANGTWRPNVELGDDAVALIALDLGRARNDSVLPLRVIVPQPSARRLRAHWVCR